MYYELTYILCIYSYLFMYSIIIHILGLDSQGAQLITSHIVKSQNLY